MNLDTLILNLYTTAKSSKKELLNFCEGIFEEKDYKKEQNRIILPIKDYIYKIAFDETGIFENFKEVKKNYEFRNISPYILNIEYIKVHTNYDLIDPFDNYYNNFSFSDDYESFDYESFDYENFRIIRIKNFPSLILQNFKYSFNNFECYLQLKRTIMSIEEQAFVGDISPSDFCFKDHNFVFKNLENIHFTNFKCEDCNTPLRFDLENLLKNCDNNFEPLYRCPFCRREYTYHDFERGINLQNYNAENDLKREFDSRDESSDDEGYSSYYDFVFED